MPNVVIEHSNNIKDIKPWLYLCHEHLMSSGLFKLPTVKVRSIAFNDHLVGGEPNQSFVVVSVTVMPGRSKEQLSQLGDSLHKKIINKCQEVGMSASTSVAIRETPDGLYFKYSP